MKENNKWYKEIVWGGKHEKIECVNHFYRWSGKTPCTGVQCCVFCGKLKEA